MAKPRKIKIELTGDWGGSARAFRELAASEVGRAQGTRDAVDEIRRQLDRIGRLAGGAL